MNEQSPLLTLSLHDLKRAVALKEQIDALQAQLTHLLGGTGGQAATPSGKKRTMSASARARIAAAQRDRWAKIHAAKAPAGKAQVKRKGKKHTMSAAGRARIGAAARARWAKFHAAKAPAVQAPAKRKRQVSAAARARLSALAKARWAKIKRAGGKAL
ncbi:MAG: hypothetical protein ACYDH9_16050 [Limisphaerales bacterium]